MKPEDIGPHKLEFTLKIENNHLSIENPKAAIVKENNSTGYEADISESDKVVRVESKGKALAK
ncbi:MAG: hypothetical protein O7C59_03015 [Rickettsia endosymbiont of Ixodes persulcatus]|nr:hypothetical protein [Rickettsia endosymbiont of Ixodes persulcatus]